MLMICATAAAPDSWGERCVPRIGVGAECCCADAYGPSKVALLLSIRDTDSISAAARGGGPHPEQVPMARFPYANFGFGGVLIGVDRDPIIMIIFADLSVG